MDTKTDITIAPGHWVLARMGKRVLRPGGKELTKKMIDNLNITKDDEVVEFAPGMGFTAEIVNKKNPKTYTAVELNDEAANRLKNIFDKENQKIIIGNAMDTKLPDASADKVYGEAMLTMQNDKQKMQIINEAYRILKKGGRYGVHEISLKSDKISPEIKLGIQKDLAHGIKVNARPLTTKEWTELFEKAGFKLVKVAYNPMHLLEPGRIINDEGLFRALKIGFNTLTHAKARKRIKEVRASFVKNEKHMQAISIVAEKL
ncbi:class I SAM-dependent methyltransferase [Balneicella halophila]|uniref:class I SAM-dependent methyltransferase n=1 Tax=Balneicella halophila TaxID=1537566 RepID=UPI001FAF901D|nr:class I SAM-dependent methyltransferase [Balneicella halophila]